MTPIDPIALRNSFGSFMTGVTVVTTVDSHGTPIGFTANSFSSVSLNPPLLSVCPATSMSSFEVFNTCEFFQVSVLGQHQQDISNTFASSKQDRFAGIAWHQDANGCPVIDDALASFSCRRWQSVPAGDHVILIGEVTSFSNREGLGLGYFHGGYFSLDMERKATEVQSHAHETHKPVLVGALLEWREGLVFLKSHADREQLELPAVSSEDNDDQPTFDVIRAHIECVFGVDVKVGSVYSVFEHENADLSSIYYRVAIDDDVELDGSAKSEYLHIPLADLKPADMSQGAVTNMLERYLVESRSGNHRLYIGTEKKGKTHRISGDFR